MSSLKDPLADPPGTSGSSVPDPNEGAYFPPDPTAPEAQWPPAPVEPAARAVEVRHTAPSASTFPIMSLLAPVLATVLSFGGVILLMGSSRSSADTVEAEGALRTAAPTARPAAASAAPATVAPARVVATSGRADALGSGTARVVFTWTLEGARNGDVAVVRPASGSTRLQEQSGALGPGVFDPVTGILTITATMPCSAQGWSAELASVHSQPPAGDATARAAAVACP